ncbi:MAG TPA: TVP38/TMEM64 family protein [Clostridia bacterium]
MNQIEDQNSKTESPEHTAAENNAKPKKKLGAYQIISIIVLAIILALSVLAIVYLIKELGWKTFFNAEGGREKVQAYIEQFGSWSKLVYVLIVFVSIILAVIPNNIVAIAGGYLYGIWPSVGLTLLGAILGSLAAFGLARAFGRPLIYQVVKPETMQKIENKLEGKNSLLFILFMLIPFIPGDAVCYAAGLTKMSFRQYLILVSITRIPGTTVSAYMGGSSIAWWVWAVFFVALFIIIALAAKFGRKIGAWLRTKKGMDALAESFEGLHDVFTLDFFRKKKAAKAEINPEDNTAA